MKTIKASPATPTKQTNERIVSTTRLNQLFLGASMLSCLCWILMEFSRWTDMGYIDSLNLPTNADSVGIPLFYGVITAVFMASIALVAFFSLRHYAEEKRTDSRILFCSIGKLHLSVFRYVILAVCLAILYFAFIPFHHATILSDLFYILSIGLGVVAILLHFTIIIGALALKKKSKPLTAKDIAMRILKGFGIAGLVIICLLASPFIAMIVMQIFIEMLSPFVH